MRRACRHGGNRCGSDVETRGCTTRGQARWVRGSESWEGRSAVHCGWPTTGRPGAVRDRPWWPCGRQNRQWMTRSSWAPKQLAGGPPGGGGGGGGATSWVHRDGSSSRRFWSPAPRDTPPPAQLLPVAKAAAGGGARAARRLAAPAAAALRETAWPTAHRWDCGGSTRRLRDLEGGGGAGGGQGGPRPPRDGRCGWPRQMATGRALGGG